MGDSVTQRANKSYSFEVIVKPHPSLKLMAP